MANGKVASIDLVSDKGVFSQKPPFHNAGGYAIIRNKMNTMLI